VCTGATATVTNTDLIAVNDSSGADTSLFVNLDLVGLRVDAQSEPGMRGCG
jgi:hypothetical protein